MSTTRKLRPYKGWVYDPRFKMFKRVADGQYFKYAASVVIEDDYLTDDDHIQLMALKAEPYEPQSTLEDVANGWFAMWINSNGPIGPEIVALCACIRSAFPHIDTPEVA